MNRILVALLMMISFVVNAKDIDAIILTTNDDEKVGFLLSETLSIGFVDNTLEFKDNNKIISYPIVDIRNISYLTENDIDSSSIDDVVTDGDAVLIQIKNDYLQISNALGKNIRIYSIGGNLLKDFLVEDTECKVSLSEFPKGIVIINCKKQSIKLYIK